MVKKVAGIIIRCADKVLLVKRSDKVDNFPNIWSIPAGHVEEDEIPYETSIRELYEETQIDSKDIKFLDFLGTIGKDRNTEFHIFLWESKRIIVPKLDFEHTEYGWFTAGNIPEPITEEIRQKVFESFA